MLRILGGCLVVAIVVGAGLAAERFISDDDLELPDEVGGLAVDDSERARDLYDYNDDKVSDAYDGADAITRLYGRDSDAPLVVTVVEAESGPPLPTGFDDPEALGLSAPLNELVDDGDVTCLVTRNPDARGRGRRPGTGRRTVPTHPRRPHGPGPRHPGARPRRGRGRHRRGLGGAVMSDRKCPGGRRA